ncbi:tripartite tricarboxylate transporter substrate-binding protein [Dankookia sp. P2]|uniref:tripartite tricarboxylate transporter substrate-binding protein n=1 Tax=Dankookia sp. P2 TaxID=3423955 RepID=UPI003D672933
MPSSGRQAQEGAPRCPCPAEASCRGRPRCPAFPAIARAEDWPGRPLRILVGFPPGGPVDVTARIVAQWLAERLGQPVLVENKPGVGGLLAAEAAAAAPPDGTTLLLCGPVHLIAPALYRRPGFDLRRDIQPVAGLVRVPLVMLVHPSVPATDAAGFIAAARAAPGRFAMASSGNGTPQHLAGELFRMMSGTELVHVPYRGSAPAITDLVGGRMQLMFEAIPASLAHVRDGRLRALAVTTATRAETLPELPPLAETLPGYEAATWYGLGVPRGTPAEVVARLNRETNAGLAQAALGARLAELGGAPMPGTPEDFARLVAAEADKLNEVVRVARITVD